MAYSGAFRQRDVWMVATKMDLTGSEGVLGRLSDAFPDRPLFAISAVTGRGLDDLTGAAMVWVSRYRTRMADDAEFAARERELTDLVADDVRRHAMGNMDAGTRRGESAPGEVADVQD